MAELNRHWTDRDVDSFLYRVGSDFIRQLQHKMEADAINQATLAARLKVTEGRVSQVLNNPGNLTLRKIIQYARVLNQKVSVVAYDDGDPNNQSGPVNAEIFETCWRRAGCPRDFFALGAAATPYINEKKALVMYVDTNVFYCLDKTAWKQNAANTRTIRQEMDYEMAESSTATDPNRLM